MKSAIVSACILAFFSASLAGAAPPSGGQSVQGSPPAQGGSQPQGGLQPQAAKLLEPPVQGGGPPLKLEDYRQITKKKKQYQGKCKIKNLSMPPPRHSCIALDQNPNAARNSWDVVCQPGTGCRYEDDDCYVTVITETDQTKPLSGRLVAEAICWGAGPKPGRPSGPGGGSLPGSPSSVGRGSRPGSPNVQNV